jgi:hypothetical protein
MKLVDAGCDCTVAGGAVAAGVAVAETTGAAVGAMTGAAVGDADGLALAEAFCVIVTAVRDFASEPVPCTVTFSPT